MRLDQLNEKEVENLEKITKASLGLVGETYLIAKLMCKFNIVSAKVPQQFFNYDLITSNGKKLEVKTGRPIWKKRIHKLAGGKKKIYRWRAWQFRRNEDQMRKGASNYVVCIGFESGDVSKEPHVFIIPPEQLENEKTGKPREVWSILINPQGESKFWEWENRWNLIVED